jgi:hypothetical protein
VEHHKMAPALIFKHHICEFKIKQCDIIQICQIRQQLT